MNETFRKMTPFHQRFREQIDKLSTVQMCNVCHESYPRINVVRGTQGPIF